MHSTEVIYLQRSDTVETVRALLSSATPGAQVWLVSPWRLRLTRDLVSLKLIRRAAQDMAIDLRLVSTHFHTQALAREAGIPVRFAIAPRLRTYRRVRDKTRNGLPSRVVPVQGRLGAYWERRPVHLGLGAVILSLVVIIVLFGVMAGVAAALIPSAQVSLRPQSSPVSGRFDVVANPRYREIDVDRSITTARVVQLVLEGHGDTPATGRLDIPDGRAEGEIVFVNRSPNVVRIPKGTVVRAGAGTNARFLTVTDVELKGALYANARVRVVAADPGLVGNVMPLTINVVEGDVARQADVLNDTSTGGGSVKQVAIIAAPEFDLLRADLSKKLQQEAYDQLAAGLAAGEFIPSNTLEVQIMSQKFDQAMGQQSDVLSMTMKVVVKGIIVDGVALNTLCSRLLEKQAANGMAILEDSLVVEPSTNVTVEENMVRLTVAARGVVAPLVDSDQIKSHIRGRKIAEASDWLGEHLELQSEPVIRVEPEWWEWIPLLPGRVEVSVLADGN